MKWFVDTTVSAELLRHPVEARRILTEDGLRGAIQLGAMRPHILAIGVYPDDDAIAVSLEDFDLSRCAPAAKALKVRIYGDEDFGDSEFFV